MAWIGDLTIKLHNWRYGVDKIAAATEKTTSPLRIGVLGAALINPPAIFSPYGLKTAKAYGSYNELLEDTEIDAVYIPSPNGLHFEHTIASLKAGKHVLVEKPIASNAQQVREIKRVSEETGKLVVEAFHWRFHPAAHKVKALIESGTYGKVVEAYAQLILPAGSTPKDDIRFRYDLAGGSCMDFTYVFSGTSYLGTHDSRTADVEVLEAQPRLYGGNGRIDGAMHAKYALRAGEHVSTCKIDADFAQPWLFGLIPQIKKAAGFYATVELERATIAFPNFVQPALGCDITVRDKATGNKETYQQYKDGPQWGSRGERWWTTYRYQLEAFVDRVRAVQSGKPLAEVYGMEGPWVTLEESEKVMSIIDKGYEKAGMPLRQ